MADGDTVDPQSTWIVPPKRVREAIDTLLSRQVHPFFPAYVHLRQVAGREGRTTELRPNWPELGKYLEMEGGPKPYFRPFWKGTRNGFQEWLNSNLAGSYAPSSLRREPSNVIETTAAGAFNLLEGHAERALQSWLGGERLPALAVAAFFLRDYGVVADDPGPEDLVLLFAKTFGYGEVTDEFTTLYDIEWRGNPGAWLERLA